MYCRSVFTDDRRALMTEISISASQWWLDGSITYSGTAEGRKRCRDPWGGDQIIGLVIDLKRSDVVSVCVFKTQQMVEIIETLDSCLTQE